MRTSTNQFNINDAVAALPTREEWLAEQMKPVIEIECTILSY
jgi:hypothetical protein